MLQTKTNKEAQTSMGSKTDHQLTLFDMKNNNAGSKLQNSLANDLHIKIGKTPHLGKILQSIWYKRLLAVSTKIDPILFIFLKENSAW